MFGRRSRQGTSLALVLCLAGCGFDTDRAAPYASPPVIAGACGTTETFFPRLLGFVREDRFEPLRRVIEARLLPTPGDPTPDPSLRTLLGALVRLVEGLGLARANEVVDLAKKGDVEQKVAPLLTTIMRFMDGEIDGRLHYESADATALFLRRCDPDHLLSAAEGVLRLTSPSHDGSPWVVALLEETIALIEEPGFQSFLDSFEREAERGRPAIISLLGQILISIADDGFTIDRVETLFESAVYPFVSPDLGAHFEALVGLIGEAASTEAPVLRPLQRAVRCTTEHPAARDDVLGFIYDVLATEEVGLDMLASATNGLISGDSAERELDLVSDALKVIREDLVIRDDLRELMAILLSRPDVELVTPVVVEMLEEGVVTELFDGAAKLLGGCGRE